MKQLIVSLPDEVDIYEHDIRRFVDAMVHKLKVHSHKGRWDGLPIEKAFSLMEGEMRELAEALKSKNLIEILLEGADVANFGLIISAIAYERGE